jgi:hypothetical protein
MTEIIVRALTDAPQIVGHKTITKDKPDTVPEHWAIILADQGLVEIVGEVVIVEGSAAGSTDSTQETKEPAKVRTEPKAPAKAQSPKAKTAVASKKAKPKAASKPAQKPAEAKPDGDPAVS